MFYTFYQNNSGGAFDENDNVAHYVIIEADNAESANKKAEEIGIYFNGCERGLDYPCCGDRWLPFSKFDKDDVTEEPTIFGESIDEFWEQTLKRDNGCIIYFKSGKIYRYKKVAKD